MTAETFELPESKTPNVYLECETRSRTQPGEVKLAEDRLLTWDDITTTAMRSWKKNKVIPVCIHGRRDDGAITPIPIGTVTDLAVNHSGEWWTRYRITKLDQVLRSMPEIYGALVCGIASAHPSFRAEEGTGGNGKSEPELHIPYLQVELLNPLIYENELNTAAVHRIIGGNVIEDPPRDITLVLYNLLGPELRKVLMFAAPLYLRMCQHGVVAEDDDWLDLTLKYARQKSDPAVLLGAVGKMINALVEKMHEFSERDGNNDGAATGK